MSALQNLMHSISDQGNVIASKVITYLGVTSIGAGATLGVANDTVQKVISHEPSVWTLPDYAALVSIFAGLSLIIKTVVDTYYKVKNERKEKSGRSKK